MSKFINNVVTLLKSCNIYNLDSQSLIYKELMAYDVGFSLIENYFNELIKEIFIKTACSYGLANYQMLFGYDFSDFNIDKKRKLLLSLNSQCKDKFDFNLFMEILSLTNENFVLKSGNLHMFILDCSENNYKSISMLDNTVSKNMAVWMKTDFSGDGKTWNEKDLSDRTFNGIDKMPISFNALDTLIGG